MFIIKIITFFLTIIEKFSPTSFDNLINNRLIKHQIDSQDANFFVLGKKSRSRSTLAFHKEPDTIEWINSFDKNSCFIDIGSNIGVFSIYAAIKKKCLVYSFEPSLNANFIFLMNIAKNNLKNKVFLHPILLSNSTSLKKFLETSIPNDSLDNLCGFNFMNSKTNEPKLLEKLNHANYFVPSFKLDDFIFDKSIDYIKIDVDGSELDVIKSGIKTIKQSSLKSIMIELDRKDKKKYEEILSILDSSNFYLDETLNQISRKSQKRNYDVYNHFFYKKNEK